MRELKNLPNHIAFIVDGNRRWAKKRGLPAIGGHRRAVKEGLDRLVFRAMDLKIKYLTFWVFSTENWKRGKKFSRMLFSLLKEGIQKKAEIYNRKGIRIKIIGDLAGLPKNLQKLLLDWEEKTKDNRKITVVMAINYGGRDEIVRACRRLFDVISREAKDYIGDSLSDKVSGLRMTKERFEENLDTVGMPDPEMIIRTGGERRLSGFLLWQAEYSELYFTDALFPDFGVEEFDKALEWYGQRKRRFGK